ncbi:MAG: universal stress protein [Chlorobi bacterium]|nr:universal stress protein [Chlorobiota bacterium]
MLRKILFPTDFSEASVRVKDKLKKMSDCGIGKVVMIHIMDERKLAFSEYIDSFSFGSFKLEKTLKIKFQMKLDEWKIEMEKAGLKVTTDVVTGTPFTTILDYAKEEKMTSIFLGHKGHDKKTEGIMLGSTAEKIARKSDITVVLI